jgi:predicted Zn-dependent protease with MMP-like domain
MSNMTITTLRWPALLRIAREETRRLLSELPTQLREKASPVPIIFMKVPGPALVRDGLEPDLLGLFIGDDVAHEGHDPFPVEILMFLVNILDEAGGDERKYRDEIRKTLLHELGHYLGLDEHELWGRGLE